LEKHGLLDTLPQDHDVLRVLPRHCFCLKLLL